MYQTHYTRRERHLPHAPHLLARDCFSPSAVWGEDRFECRFFVGWRAAWAYVECGPLVAAYPVQAGGPYWVELDLHPPAGEF